MLTGHDDSALHGLASALHANAFLRKPATFGNLKTDLERIVSDPAAGGTPDAFRAIDVAATIEAMLEKTAPAKDPMPGDRSS
jgi:hypothetical protein